MTGWFYVRIRKPRRKILDQDLKYKINNVKCTSENIYRIFSDKPSTFRYRCFPYFKLVRKCGGYQYHFLVVRKVYQIEKMNVSHHFNNCSFRIEIDETSWFYFCDHF